MIKTVASSYQTKGNIFGTRQNQVFSDMGCSELLAVTAEVFHICARSQ